MPFPLHLHGSMPCKQQSDNSYIGDINVTCPDEVKRYFLSAFPHCFSFDFGLGGIAGGAGLQRVVCAMVVGRIPGGYIPNVPLPPVPVLPSTQSSPQVHTIPEDYNTMYLDPTYNSFCSLVYSAAYHAFSPAWHAIAINN
jgi:hypothetical protein